MFVIQILARTMEPVTTHLPHQDLVQLVSQVVVLTMSVHVFLSTLVIVVNTKASVKIFV